MGKGDSRVLLAQHHDVSKRRSLETICAVQTCFSSCSVRRITVGGEGGWFIEVCLDGRLFKNTLIQRKAHLAIVARQSLLLQTWRITSEGSVPARFDPRALSFGHGKFL